ncbi:mannose-1-phosphate guanylyltransferase [Cytophagaceae bacterium ABcell3]|nr:mannose-1-phosphate guanylyltransferase [Cytophagaceae bacterium ABcell3]
MGNKNYYAVIMAGGIGSRFWPFSREKHPKQFHDVLGTGKSMIQQTVERFEGVCPLENIFIVTNKAYVSLVKEQLPFLSKDQILAEPIGRNTAPCIAYACYKIQKKNPEANVVVAPSDHVILKEEEFKRKILFALEAASASDNLITLGIKPSRPDTGYGYIQYINDNSEGLKKVKTFTEKPVLELAQKFLESGDFVWNAGIFVWSVKNIINSFRTHMSEMADVFEEGAKSYYTDQEEVFINRAYSLCKNISIDYGIMEKAENVYVVLSDFGWSDLGTWKSLYDILDKNEDGNVLQGDILTYDTKDCIVKTPSDKLVVIDGLEDFIVAEYDGVLMICRKSDEQRVKDFVSDVKARKDKRYI